MALDIASAFGLFPVVSLLKQQIHGCSNHVFIGVAHRGQRPCHAWPSPWHPWSKPRKSRPIPPSPRHAGRARSWLAQPVVFINLYALGCQGPNPGRARSVWPFAPGVARPCPGVSLFGLSSRLEDGDSAGIQAGIQTTDLAASALVAVGVQLGQKALAALVPLHCSQRKSPGSSDGGSVVFIGKTKKARAARCRRAGGRDTTHGKSPPASNLAGDGDFEILAKWATAMASGRQRDSLKLYCEVG